MGHVMVHNTHGKDDIERASLTFVVGNTALSSSQRTTVLLTIEGVWVATKGYADNLQANGFAPLSDLVQQFVTNGGELWVCGACAKPRQSFLPLAWCQLARATKLTRRSLARSRRRQCEHGSIPARTQPILFWVARLFGAQATAQRTAASKEMCVHAAVT